MIQMPEECSWWGHLPGLSQNLAGLWGECQVPSSAIRTEIGPLGTVPVGWTYPIGFDLVKDSLSYASICIIAHMKAGDGGYKIII